MPAHRPICGKSGYFTSLPLIISQRRQIRSAYMHSANLGDHTHICTNSAKWQTYPNNHQWILLRD